ncbi:MAG TPA: hypothetical protein VH416_08875 [Gaiellaceae bacterium]
MKLFDEERVAVGSGTDPLPQLPILRACLDICRTGIAPDATQLLEQTDRLFFVKRLDQRCGCVWIAVAPRGPVFQQVRPSHAKQENRRVARERSHLLYKVEERLFAPMQIVEHTNQRRVLRFLLEQLEERPGDLLCARPRLDLPEQRTNRGCGRLVLGQRIELLDDLHYRPVRDPLAIRQTTSAHHPRLQPGKKLGGQPRLPDPGVPEDRKQPAGALTQRLVEDGPQLLQLGLAPNHRRRTSMFRRRATQRQKFPGSHRLRLPFQLQRPDGRHVDRALDESHRAGAQ